MNIRLNKKHKIALIIIGFLIISSITISISYAYWQITKKQTNANLINTGCFDVTFEETGNDISLNNAFPISDQKGLSEAPYKFKIKNICTHDSEYYVTLNSFGATDTLLDENSIKYAFDLSTKKYPTSKILGDSPENTNTGDIDLDNLIKSYYLKGGYLRAGEEKEFSLYLWMDQNAPMSEMNKVFTSKIYITNIATDEAPLLANLRATSSVAPTGVFLNGPLVKNTIESIKFTTSNTVPNGVLGSWDVSEQQNGAIMAWYYDSDSNGLYEVIIGQEDGVVANSNSSYLFQNLRYLKTINLANLDTSNVTDMKSMFNQTGYNSTVFTLDLGDEFDTSNATDMYQMFNYTGFKSSVFTLDLGNKFDTSNVTTMEAMFVYTGYNSTVFTLDLGEHFDTSKVLNMSGMFNGTGNSSTVFTLNLGDKFDTSKVTDMSYMFYYTGDYGTAFTLDLGNNFNTSSVINMEGMFNGTGNNSLVFTLDLGDQFNTSNVTNMSYMFSGTGKSSTVFTLDLGDKFDTSKVTDMSSMFSSIGYKNLSFILDLRTFNFDSVTVYSSVFYQSKASDIVYVKNESDKSWVSDKGFAGSIIDCSSNTCP